MAVTLREVRDADLPEFRTQLTDPALHRMAAVTRKYHYDRAAFDDHWAKVRADPEVLLRTILLDGEVAGHVAAFGPVSSREVTYVVGPRFWGRGVATAALREFLALERVRPLHADAAADNAGSVRVLEKCGFTVTGRTRCFAQARGEEIDLVQLTLE
ncbi:GNAT family N-acetyltransferase [Amycolatopsis sp. cmx-8-4]|uniref:GNAT family N-acetyltransferase n=1 Tax=Amycolatopsis sp. cmx-8-4 TaxID=2790947 RepID=UPI00397B1085